MEDERARGRKRQREREPRRIFVHKRKKSLKRSLSDVYIHTIRRDVYVYAFGDPFVPVPHYRNWCIRQSNTAGGIPIAARPRRSV